MNSSKKIFLYLLISLVIIYPYLWVIHNYNLWFDLNWIGNILVEDLLDLLYILVPALLFLFLSRKVKKEKIAKIIAFLLIVFIIFVTNIIVDVQTIMIPQPSELEECNSGTCMFGTGNPGIPYPAVSDLVK